MRDWINPEDPVFKFEMSDVAIAKLARFVAPYVHQLMKQNESPLEDLRPLSDGEALWSLSVRARHCLDRGGIKTVDDAKKVASGEKEIKGCGDGVRLEIVLMLINHFGVTRFN